MAIDWTLEALKLTLSAATPLTVIMVGWWLKQREQINGELIRKRIAIYDMVAPPANDIFCFFLGVGHWSDLDPDKILKCKREIDRTMYRHQFFWTRECWSAYQVFIHTFFETYKGPGQPAALRIDPERLRRQIGSGYRAEWEGAFASAKAPDAGQLRKAYDNWMLCLAAEIGGDRMRNSRKG